MRKLGWFFVGIQILGSLAFAAVMVGPIQVVFHGLQVVKPDTPIPSTARIYVDLLTNQYRRPLLIGGALALWLLVTGPGQRRNTSPDVAAFDETAFDVVPAPVDRLQKISHSRIAD